MGFDTRRLSTLDVLGSDILNKKPPEFGLPEGREEAEVGEFHIALRSEEMTAALEAGKILNASNYYGIPKIWKDGDRYKGVLLQYRSVSDTLDTADQAEAIEWFCDHYSATDG